MEIIFVRTSYGATVLYPQTQKMETTKIRALKPVVLSYVIM